MRVCLSLSPDDTTTPQHRRNQSTGNRPTSFAGGGVRPSLAPRRDGEPPVPTLPPAAAPCGQWRLSARRGAPWARRRAWPPRRARFFGDYALESVRKPRGARLPLGVVVRGVGSYLRQPRASGCVAYAGPAQPTNSFRPDEVVRTALSPPDSTRYTFQPVRLLHAVADPFGAETDPLSHSPRSEGVRRRWRPASPGCKGVFSARPP